MVVEEGDSRKHAFNGHSLIERGIGGVAISGQQLAGKGPPPPPETATAVMLGRSAFH